MEKEVFPQKGTALLEIGTEELPASFFYGAAEQLQTFTEKKLSSCRLEFDKLRVYGTPRRIVMEILGLVSKQRDQTREVKGPAKSVSYDKEGNPTPALLGFLKGQGAELESVFIKDFSGKPYVFLNVHEKGRQAHQVLSEILPDLIHHLTFPKSMRWDGNFSFGRPIRWLLALFEEKVIHFKLESLQSNRHSFGHRFLSSGQVSISHPSDYQAGLKEAYVIADNQVRKELIKNQLENLALSKSARVYRMEPLIDEVALLVEYPTAFLGSFDKRFLTLPQDVLITVMQHHQRYFPLMGNDGKLLHYFVGVRNGNEEGIEDVRSGNEQVLHARFKDAEYFFGTDKKTKLLDRYEKLDRLVFQKNLGTMKQKVERLISPVLYLSARILKEGKEIPKEEVELLSNKKKIEEVVRLSKCDLTTQMVFELPELQGIMGKEYAGREGYPDLTSQAILDHYLPRFQGDDFPKTMIGALLGIANRMDTLTGSFGLRLEPSGSSDPLGLRRAAATLMQIVLEKGLNLDLLNLMAKSFDEYQNQQFTNVQDRSPELENFLADRTASIWKSEEIRYDLFRVFQAAGSFLKEPASVFKRACFLENLRNSHKQKFTDFALAWIRIFNIVLSKEAQLILQESIHRGSTLQPSLLNLPEEMALYDHLQSHEIKVHGAFEKEKIQEGFEALSGFQTPINTFFDKVLVMDPDATLKKNRLLLLWNLRNLMLESFGDLTQIVLD